MPRKKPQALSAGEIFRTLSAGLRTAATRPTVYGYVPHPKQLKFHMSHARGKQFIGGNRSGKTVGGAVELVDRMMGRDPFKPVKHMPPIRARAVTVDILQGINKIMLPEVARWIPPSQLINGSWEDSYNKTERTLTLANKSWCEFMTYEQDLEKFAGTSRHCCWFDEEPPKDIFDECLMRLIDTSGDWWMTMTPVEGMTWTYDTVYLASLTNPDLFVVEVETDENPHINTGEIDILQSGLTQQEKEARRRGHYMARQGLIYKGLSDRNFIDFFMPPRDWLHFRMMDHGLANPTAWLWGAVNPDGFMVIYMEHYKAGEVVSWHAAEITRITEMLGRVPDYNVGDPSIQNADPLTGTSVQIEYAEHGVPICLGNNDVRAGINLVETKLIGAQGVPFLYICKDTCPNLTWEIQRYRWGSWQNKKVERDKNKKEEPQKKDDHAVDALRYGVASRPVGDTGEYIPENFGSMGASKADSPYDEYTDTRLTKSRDTYVDSVLGSEY